MRGCGLESPGLE